MMLVKDLILRKYTHTHRHERPPPPTHHFKFKLRGKQALREGAHLVSYGTRKDFMVMTSNLANSVLRGTFYMLFLR